MTQVWGPRAGASAARFVKNGPKQNVDLEQLAELVNQRLSGFNRSDGSDAVETRQKIRELTFTKIGVVRNEKGLSEALEQLPGLRDEAHTAKLSCTARPYNREWIESIQNQNLIQVAEMVAQASLMRTESRGALYRTDYPMVNNIDWLKHIVVKKDGEQMNLRTEPVNLCLREPKREIRTYGVKE